MFTKVVTVFLSQLALLHKHCFMYRLCLTITLLCLCISSIVGSAATAEADSIPGGNVTDPTVRAVDIAQPAVVRIITSVNAHLRVHFSATNTVTFPQNKNSYPLQLSGSGTFITSQGDILTADHVINPPHDQSMAQFLDDTAAQDVANYINSNTQTKVIKDQVSQALQTGQLPSDPIYDTPKSIVLLSTAYTGPLSAPDFQSLPPQVSANVDKIEKESAVDQEDIAIIHTPFQDTPGVQLGNSSTVQTQDSLTIIGFPGNGDINNRPTDLLTSSVNKINVSSIKTAPSGAPVIQVGGNVEHGDSGGPALDNHGNIVGIVSFGTATQDSPGGTSFLQASNSASDIVKSLNLNTRSGPFQMLWSQAFNDYAATTPGHWHQAQRELNQLATSYPLFQAVKPYLAYAQGQAKTEQLPSPQSQTKSSSNSPNTNSLTALLITIGSVVLLLLLIVFLFALVLRKRHKKETKPQGKPGVASNSPIAAPPFSQQNSFNVPPNNVTPTLQDGMTAFGAPVRGPQSNSVPMSSSPGSAQTSGSDSAILRPWPCGHLNRSNARFCSICGEPTPPASRRVEQ